MTVRSLLVANFDVVVGGGEVGLLMLAEGLCRRGHRPVVALPGARDGELAGRLEEAGVPWCRLGGDPDTMPARLREVAVDVDADVVHVWSGGGVVLVDAAGLALPVVYHELMPGPRPDDAAVAARADVVVVNSRATAARFPGRSVELVPNGVAEPRPTAGRLDLDRAHRTIGLLGATCRRKGQLDALPALVEVIGRTDDVDVAFVGRVAGPEALRLRRVARASGGRMRLLGYVPHAADHLGELALVLVPSRSEGFGRVAVEALRAGVPVLARPVDGLPEALADHDDPWLPEDRATWADRILAELDSPTHTPDELRRAAVRFDPDRFVDRIAAIHRRLARPQEAAAP